MASLVAAVASLRKHYGKATSIFIAVIFLTLYNYRWIVGYSHYHGEFKLAAGGYNAINLDCNHTLNELNIWDRVQCNEQWYFVSGCKGNRDGCQTFSNPVNILDESPLHQK